MKINLAYKWIERQKPVLSILNIFKRNHRKIKKRLKIALTEISRTLDIYNWNATIRISQFGGEYEITEYYILIELESKINNISGYINFGNEKEILNKNQGWRGALLNHFFYLDNNKENKFYKDLTNSEHTIFFIIENFQNKTEHPVDFPQIENKDIAIFKRQHEGLLNYVYNKDLIKFSISIDNCYCGLQTFYVSNKIYWTSFYSTPDFYNDDNNIGYNNLRDINTFDRNSFILSLIEAQIININQDIEEVLTWSLEDIFAMSKLIGY